MRIAQVPPCSRITVTGNNFSNSYIGDGSQKRQKVDSEAAGIVLNGTSDIAISGNSFAGLTTPAVTWEGDPSTHVLFSNNVLADVPRNGDARPGQPYIGENNMRPGLPVIP